MEETPDLQFGEVLEFLLNSFRAKLTICSTSSNNSKKNHSQKGPSSVNSNSAVNVVDECPFNFNHFLAKGRELLLASSEQRKQAVLWELKSLQREGLLDSISPYLISFMRHAARLKSHNSASTGRPSLLSLRTPDTLLDTSICIDYKHQPQQQPSNSKSNSPDYPIVIHISDEVKSVYQDFYCQQSILVQEMGYFSIIISKGQKLHDMDITIHCDVTIFEWLMRWIHFSTGQSSEAPELDAVNVVGLTVSSDFLQMPALKLTCLKYLADNIESVVEKSPNLGCLSDSLLAELATKLDIVELEDKIAPCDRLDRITSKLYSQFILVLNQPAPNIDMGHYASTSSLFQCKLCDQLMTNEVAIQVPCARIKFDWGGKLFSCHEKNEHWTFGNYIICLKRELKTWRKVYWSLWGTVHFFECDTCQVVFPGIAYKYCSYHSENPRFLVEVVSEIPKKGNDEDKSPRDNTKSREKKPTETVSTPPKEYVYKPYGKYPCCKTSTYKYLTSPDFNGCQRKDHTISKITGASEVLHKYLELITMEAENSYFKKLSLKNKIQLSIGKSSFPINLAPSTTVSPAHPISSRGEPMTAGGQPDAPIDVSSSNDEDDSSSSDSEHFPLPSATSASGLSYRTTTNTTTNQFDQFGSSRGTKSSVSPETWIWNNDLSTRYNQDMQREMEEKLMLNLTLFLSQRVPIDNNFDIALSQFTQQNSKSYQNNFMFQENSGSFVKLEQAWLEEQSGRHGRSPSTSNTII